jgi:hypothetical protein
VTLRGAQWTKTEIRHYSRFSVIFLYNHFFSVHVHSSLLYPSLIYRTGAEDK